MARKAGQLISRGSRTWLVRISLGRASETALRATLKSLADYHKWAAEELKHLKHRMVLVRCQPRHSKLGPGQMCNGFPSDEANWHFHQSCWLVFLSPWQAEYVGHRIQLE